MKWWEILLGVWLLIVFPSAPFIGKFIKSNSSN